MRVLLDTVTFVYAMMEPQRLSKRARKVFKKASAIRELSVISVAEIALKASKQKLAITETDLLSALSAFDVRLLPFDAGHALRLFNLPRHHGDPFDRQIIAQALSENMPVLTCDREFLKYRDLEVLW
jgi:PIN domain nuclease of toxin-antitoxin system